MNKTLVMLPLLLICAICGEESARAATDLPGLGSRSRTAQPRMRSLRIAGADALNRRSLPGDSRAMAVSGGADAAQLQSGTGNKQAMIVNAGGGKVTQRQSGSGNSQSMNIGVVDG